MGTTAYILIVDSERKRADFLAQYFNEHGYGAKGVVGISEMNEVIRAGEAGFVILDISVSGDELAVCRRLRASSEVPIILLISSDKKDDRVTGLEYGADDCLAKPFNPRELLARVKAVLRRAGLEDGPLVATTVAKIEHDELTCMFAGFQLISASRTLVSPAGVRVDLRCSEYKLLTAFLTHPNRILTLEQLASLTGNEAIQPIGRAIEIQICRLREKIEADPHKPALIKTVRGNGYMFSEKVTCNKLRFENA